jgi:hypothetical protein
MFFNQKRLLLTLYRLEEGQQEILHRLDRLHRGGGAGEGGPAREDEWMQRGIDNILSYQVGKKGGKRG